MPSEASRLNPLKHAPKINCAFTWFHMDLEVAGTVSDTDLAEARHIKTVDKPVNPLRHEMSVIYREGPFDRRGGQPFKINSSLLQRMG